MAGLGRKVFTAGDVLTASDVQSYLQDQTVMNFAGTAARSSAIATPTTGMTTYNQTTQQLESYNGTAYVGMSGLQLIKKQTIGSTVSSVAVTGAFSATYEAYKIIVTGGVASTGSMVQFQLGSTTTGYYNAGFYATYAGGSVLNTPTSNGSNWSHCGYGNTNSIYMGIELFNPFLAKNTQMTSSAAQSATGGIGLFNSGYLNDTTSYTGFTLIPAVGTLTGGTIYVYGYGV
jgi:hypothetical protein